MLPDAEATVYAAVATPEEPCAIVTVKTKDGTLVMHLHWDKHLPAVRWDIQRGTHPLLQLMQGKREEPLEPWQHVAEEVPAFTMTDAVIALSSVARAWESRNVPPTVSGLLGWLQGELHSPEVRT